MSDGPRIPIDKARAVASKLMSRWEMNPADCFIVGSVRRDRDDVGDLELLAPVPPEGTDPLCDRIAPTIAGTGLWQEEKPNTIGEEVNGLKRGFLACSLLITLKPKDADPIQLPVQIYRYTPENLGWMLIERTGPREFGMWFLGAWKKQFGIPRGQDEHKASIKNHLVDARGEMVAVPTEEGAFRMAGLTYIRATERDAFIRRRDLLANGSRR